MDQRISAPGVHNGYDASGGYCYLGIVRILAGKISFLVDGQKKAVESSTFLMVVPRNSVVSLVLEDVDSCNVGYFSKSLNFFASLTQPELVPIPEVLVETATFEDLVTYAKTAHERISISVCSLPHQKSLLIKNFLGEHFNEDHSLRELARAAALEPSVLSRVFRKDWGKPPIHFRNYLRIMDSFRQLASEAAVTDVAYNVGFSDLSRFNKQFKETAGVSPSKIRKKSKNAK